MSDKHLDINPSISQEELYTGKDLAKLLKIVTDELEKMSSSDISSVLDGESLVEIRIRKKAARPIDLPTHAPTSSMSLEELKNKLFQCERREQGILIVRENIKNREGLEAFAKYLDLPAQKKDRIAKLEERIIEATIGFRLTSLTFKEYRK